MRHQASLYRLSAVQIGKVMADPGAGWIVVSPTCDRVWRGLIVMRYGIEKRFVDQVGAPATRQIMIDAEAHMSREGFSWADGVDLKGLLSHA